MADILVADDTKSIQSTLRILLEEDGHEVRIASNGEEALAEYSRRRPDMLLLDVMMPKKNGYQVLKQIRRGDPSLPVIFLSAKGSPADVSLGLDLGSDDYLPKPFDGEVLLSRIKAVFRRTMPQPSATAVPSQNGAKDEFMVGSHRVDAKRYRIVGPKGREEALSEREVELLRWFVAHPSEVVKREDIFCGLWGYSATVTTRAVDQQILKLRKKLGKDGVCIETVHRLGYRYVQG
jgi:DNA-binding response OmpR family regulator